MPTTLRALTTIFALLLLLPGARAADWIAESNEHARLVLDNLAKYSPEGAGGLGVDGLDEQIFDLRAGIYERSRDDAKRILEELRTRHAEASHPKIRQDIEILIGAVEDGIETGCLR